MALSFSNRLLQALKQLIKSHGFTYLEVAKEMKMSESGFKKLINSEDCSLKKIDNICKIIGIRTKDLFDAIEKKQLVDTAFTSAQESFFNSSRVGFLLYWLLVYERRSTEKSFILLKIDDRVGWSLLRKMDKLRLLKVLPMNQLGLPAPVGVRWVGKSEFIFNLYKKWALSLLQNVLKQTSENKDNQENIVFLIRYLQMSESTWQEFKLALEELERTFANKAATEMRLKVSDLRHVRWIWAVDNESWAEREL